MMDGTATYQRRERYLTRLLSPAGLYLFNLSDATRARLYEYADLMLTAADAPASSWSPAIAALCAAVEAEIEVRFAEIPGLSGAGSTRLEDRARLLADPAHQQQLALFLKATSLSAGYFLHVLPDQLAQLAEIRAATEAVHGAPEPRPAANEDFAHVQWLVFGTRDSLLPRLAKIDCLIK